MNELIAYLLKASAGTVILYLCFLFFFRKDTFYFRNRVILILTLVIPMIIPLIKTTWFTPATVQPEEVPLNMIVINSAITAGEIVSGKVNSFDYNELITAILLSVSGLLILRMMIGIIKTVSIIRKGHLHSAKFPKLVLSDKDHPPFSFWPYAVIPKKLYQKGDAEDIIAHENAHIRQGHTFDLILIELYTSVFWFNPAAWLVKRAVKTNHEYLADHELTSRLVNIKDYQYRLLSIPAETNRLQFAHSFNSLIKNRIIMINRKPTRTYATWKNLLILPVVALIFAAFSFKAVNPMDNNETTTPEAVKMAPLNSEATNSVRELTDPAIEKTNGVQTSKEVQNQADTVKKSTALFVPGIGRVYSKVEQMPQFPGGEKEMMKFIMDNMKYPPKAKEMGIQGTVIASFIVNDKGKVVKVKIVRGIGSGCDEEALRVIKSMPDWTPGKQGGKAVNVSYLLPVKFTLSANKTSIASKQEEIDGEKVYVAVEQMPQFPGGEDAMRQFIKDNLKYPEKAKKNGIQGVVLVNFVIGRDGKISRIKVMRSVGSGCDEEAIRILEKMPAWKPGKQGGKAVPVAYTIPVKFTLATGTLKPDDSIKVTG